MSIFEKSIQPWHYDTQQCLDHGESSEKAEEMRQPSRDWEMKAVRLFDLEENEFTKPINVDRLKLYFERQKVGQSATEDLTRQEKELMHACIHVTHFCIPCLCFISDSQVQKKKEESNENKIIRNLESTVLDSGSNPRVEAHVGIRIEKESKG